MVLGLVDEIAAREVQLPVCELGFYLLEVARNTVEAVGRAPPLDTLVRPVEIIMPDEIRDPRPRVREVRELDATE